MKTCFQFWNMKEVGSSSVYKSILHATETSSRHKCVDFLNLWIMRPDQQIFWKNVGILVSFCAESQEKIITGKHAASRRFEWYTTLHISTKLIFVLTRVMSSNLGCLLMFRFYCLVQNNRIWITLYLAKCLVCAQPNQQKSSYLLNRLRRSAKG